MSLSWFSENFSEANSQLDFDHPWTKWTHLVRYARPSSDWRYSNIELVYVAGIATSNHLTKLSKKRCGCAVTKLETILQSKRQSVNNTVGTSVSS